MVHKVLIWLLLLTSFSLGSRTVEAQDYSQLFRGFQEQYLTPQDKRFLQAALAFEGHYNGLLDGDWGPISRRALTRYAQSEFGSPAQDWHMAVLALSYFQRFEIDGWRMEYFDGLDMSFLFPSKSVIPDPTTDNFVNWRHSGSSLAFSVGVAGQQATSRFHEYTLSRHSRREPPYTVRRPGFAVTSSQSADGKTLYTRSNFLRGQWSTVMLSADSWDASTLNAVAASISVGRAEPVIFTEGGRLYSVVMDALAYAGDGDPPADTRRPDDRAHGRSGGHEAEAGSGTGFFVSESGHVLTNAHVVEGCMSIRVNGKPGRVVSVSEEFDLALIDASIGDDDAVARFSPVPAKLNSDVTVAGYPYAGLLGGINITRGTVSSVMGLGGEGTTMQITAPVQSGNSGGPVIAADGEVVGVVVSKLDAVKFADALGDLPQNVNFAIRGEIAKLFLFQNGVEPLFGYSDGDVRPVELADQATKFTVFVNCD